MIRQTACHILQALTPPEGFQQQSHPADQIRLLVFAARQPEVLTIVEAVRALVESTAAEDSAPQLKVAEDK